MRNLRESMMGLSPRTLIYGLIIFSAILVSGLGTAYVAANYEDKIAVVSEKNESERSSSEGVKTRVRVTAEGIAKRLKAAVDTGKITQEQADERWKGFKDRLDSARGGN